MSLSGLESMLKHCTQFATWTLLILQVLLPSSAPWLHYFGEAACCVATASKEVAPSCKCHHHADSQPDRATKCADSPAAEGGESPDDSPPHDCTDCAICQAIAAPRILALLVELPVLCEQTATISVPECADPLLGFGLPLQCRAPPAV
jgi:hypothetical protein